MRSQSHDYVSAGMLLSLTNSSNYIVQYSVTLSVKLALHVPMILVPQNDETRNTVRAAKMCMDGMSDLFDKSHHA